MPTLTETLLQDSRQSAAGDADPDLMASACENWLVAIVQTDASEDVSAEDVTELGEYGLNLCSAASHWARQQQDSETLADLQELIATYALWLAREGAELLTLEPVVDALAYFANQTHDPQQLTQLYSNMGDILDAVAAVIRQDLEKTNPGRPWRVLNLNRAIVATRTHNPELMEEAFKILVENLPEEAPRFFSEGMEQMELLNYPAPVREVMAKYNRQWNLNRSLH